MAGLDRERMVLEIRRAGGPFLAFIVLVAVSITCIAVIFANNGITLPWDSTYTRQVALDNAKGIVAKKQTVRLAGVIVGRIEKIKLENGTPIATISLSGKYAPLYRNARLTLRPETPLDDMYLDILSRGTKSAGELGKHQILPAQRTQVPVDVSSVLDVFNADTRSRVKVAIDALGRGLGPEGPAFEQALVDLAPFLKAAKQLTYQTSIRQTETARLVHNFNLVTTELGNRDVEVRQLVGNGASALTELGNNQASVEQVVGQLPGTMAQLESTFATVRNTASHLDPAFDALQPVAHALPSGLTELAKFGKAATPALTRLERPLPKLNRLMQALRPTASDLHKSLTALSPFPAQLSTVTNLLAGCETAIGKFFQNTISLGKFSSNLSVILRGEAVAGLNSGGGVVNDQTVAPSCAPGGPSK